MRIREHWPVPDNILNLGSGFSLKPQIRIWSLYTCLLLILFKVNKQRYQIKYCNMKKIVLSCSTKFSKNNYDDRYIIRLDPDLIYLFPLVGRIRNCEQTISLTINRKLFAYYINYIIGCSVSVHQINDNCPGRVFSLLDERFSIINWYGVTMVIYFSVIIISQSIHKGVKKNLHTNWRIETIKNKLQTDL